MSLIICIQICMFSGYLSIYILWTLKSTTLIVFHDYPKNKIWKYILNFNTMPVIFQRYAIKRLSIWEIDQVENLNWGNFKNIYNSACIKVICKTWKRNKYNRAFSNFFNYWSFLLCFLKSKVYFTVLELFVHPVH